MFIMSFGLRSQDKLAWIKSKWGDAFVSNTLINSNKISTKYIIFMPGMFGFDQLLRNLRIKNIYGRIISVDIDHMQCIYLPIR